jgi:hypothetical protein
VKTRMPGAFKAMRIVSLMSAPATETGGDSTHYNRRGL